MIKCVCVYVFFIIFRLHDVIVFCLYVQKKLKYFFKYVIECSEPRHEQTTTRTRTLQTNRRAVG